VVIATAAVLALGQLGEMVDRPAVVACVRADRPDLDRTPEGFSAVGWPTLRAELAVRAAGSLRVGDESLATELVSTLPSGIDRATVVATLCPALADLVVANSVEWTNAEEAARAGVLARLPTHWHRLAVAGALRPWPPDAVDAAGVAAQWQHWDTQDTAALVRVMTDQAPELTRPEGLDDGHRWWVVAGSPWDWTVWRSDDERFALEVLRSGWSATCASRVLDPAQVLAWRTGGIASLSATVAALRDS
jgi:hypothetical protein